MTTGTPTPPLYLEPTAPGLATSRAIRVRRIGHDLNNALGGIGMFVETLSADLTSAQARDDLAQIESLMQRARELVRQLQRLDQE